MAALLDVPISSLKEAPSDSAMGAVLLNADCDWSGAKREHRRAIELNPGSATAHSEYGAHLAWEGWYDEAIAEMTRAIELDPLDYLTNMWIAFALHIARLYEAIKGARHWDATSTPDTSSDAQ